MLKRLEMIGFKSFADRTVFDFAPGITGIIGPNGSGKSNVVDAVRWVLGEQSAKSLRGGEMTDVIFNGSASRRSLGLAEVSMVFDNRKKVLATEAEEVRITRRVYRSGEGEYLINNQACRLKDVKDLFLGSGAGTDAYCIIQQGQVDVLLQTAPKERRTIFEEAAGISRFKARKLETLRRLERVDANLQRLRDILDEVEKNLRSVKLQASKAQRFQEHSARLKELRVGLSLHKYHELNEQLQADAAELARLRAELDSETSEADSRQRDLDRLGKELEELEKAIDEQQETRNEANKQIATGWSTGGHQRTEHGRLIGELASARLRLAEQTVQVAALTATCAAARAELLQAQEQHQQQQQTVKGLDEQLAALESELTDLKHHQKESGDALIDEMNQAAYARNTAGDRKRDLDGQLAERRRVRARAEQASSNLQSLAGELEGLNREEELLQAQLTAARAGLDEIETEQTNLGQAQEETKERLNDLAAQRSGLVSRIDVLEKLERSHEGLGTGVREVFAHLESGDPGP
jgi:chromosome segregation protein